METMWSTWSDQNHKLSKLTPSNLVLVTCSTDFPYIAKLSGVQYNYSTNMGLLATVPVIYVQYLD